MTNPDHEHLDDTWLPRFTTLRMTAFGETVIKIANSSDFDEWTFSQKIAYAIEEEEAAREQRRFLKLLKASKSPNPHACVAEIDYRPERNLSRELTSRLASCQWIHQGTNAIILGKSSVGKTYLAQALLTEACRHGYTARFFRTDDLAAQLAVLEISDPQRLALTAELANTDLLVLDDFLTTPISDATAAALFNILSSRDGRCSTMVTSQFAPDEWYGSMTDKVIAESLLNRLITGVEVINIDGPNMRAAPIMN